MPIFASRTGSDVYFQRLAAGLGGRGLRADVLTLPWLYEFGPAIPRNVRQALGGYDLIHTNADWGPCFQIPAKPLLLTMHHCVLDPRYRAHTSAGQRAYHRGLLRSRLQRGLGLARTVFCPSHATRDATIAAFPQAASKLRYIPHGIDLRGLAPPARGTRRSNTLLSVGTVSARKGSALFPALMDRLGPQFELRYVGRGNGERLRHPLIRRQADLAWDRLLELYRSCAVFVSLSRLEGFGYAVAEAMACAAPVVVPAASALPELIGDCALQLFPVDDLDQCAARIRAICCDDELSRSLGDGNRLRIEQRFGFERMIDAYVEAYREALG